MQVADPIEAEQASETPLESQTDPHVYPELRILRSLHILSMILLLGSLVDENITRLDLSSKVTLGPCKISSRSKLLTGR